MSYPSRTDPPTADRRRITTVTTESTPPAIPERVTIFDAAEKVNPYELARHWGDRLRLPTRVAPEKAKAVGLDVRTAEDELEELAIMSALRSWLDRWTANQ